MEFKSEAARRRHIKGNEPTKLVRVRLTYPMKQKTLRVRVDVSQHHVTKPIRALVLIEQHQVTKPIRGKIRKTFGK